MSEPSNQTTPPIPASKELRQHMLDQLSAGQQRIEELSDEELDRIAGGATVGELVGHSSSGSFHSMGSSLGHSSSSGSSVHLPAVAQGTKPRGWRDSTNAAITASVATAVSAAGVGIVSSNLPQPGKG